MDLKRNVKCSGCGNEVNFAFTGSIDLQQMSAVGKCPSCGRMLQIDFAIVEKSATAAQTPQQTQLTSEVMPSDNGALPNLDESLFQDQQTDLLKNIMD